MAARAGPLLRDFELVVMLAVLALGDAPYPLAIADAIERKTGRRTSRAAVLITLERLAWWTSRMLAAVLFEVTPTDLRVYALVAVVLLIAGLGAALRPALRAARADPLVALRAE